MVGVTKGVSEMAADPHVTAVGGTQFNPSFDGSGNFQSASQEVVWNDPNTSPCVPGASGCGASGGGQSALFTRAQASYQNGVNSDSSRDIPDIAIGAGENGDPGFYFVDDPSHNNGASLVCCIGGTSLSSTLWTGISKLVAQVQGGRIGNINARLYQLAQLGGSSSGLHDVTVGNNHFSGVTSCCDAGPGYDLTTGWGTPDIDNFVRAFVGLTISPQSAGNVSGARGATLNTGSFTINNVSGGTLSINSVTIALSNPAVFSSFTVTPNGSSAVTVMPTAASMTFTFSGLTISSGGSLSFATSGNAVTASAEPTIQFASIGFSNMGGGGSGHFEHGQTIYFVLIAMLGALGGLSFSGRRRFSLRIAGLAILLFATIAGCGGGGGGGGGSGGGGGGGGPLATMVTLTGVSSNLGSIPESVQLSAVTVQ
jgi:hypothetical protein